MLVLVLLQSTARINLKAGVLPYLVSTSLNKMVNTTRHKHSAMQWAAPAAIDTFQ